MIQPIKIMSDQDLGELSAAPAGRPIAYGEDPLQFGELTLPMAAASPYPLVINIHGGCWLAQYNIDHSRAQAQALADTGVAVWNIEYRRVGNTGGGWPGTFLDVGRAADHARVLGQQYPLDMSRVVAMGHSAGGHLALWLGARSRLSRGSPLYVTDPLPLCGIVALAPATDLVTLHEQKVFDHVVDKLMGGSPGTVPDRYDAAMPSRLLPLGVRQVIITGAHDDVWRHNSETYAEVARLAQDPNVEYHIAPAAGHFEPIAPRSSTWPLVLHHLQRMLTP